MTTPEARARQNIDSQPTACGWIVQDRATMNLYARGGVAVREFPLETGYADYLLFVVIGSAGPGAGNIRQLEAGGAIEAGDFEAGV